MKKVFKPPLWVGVMLFVFFWQKQKSKAQEVNKDVSLAKYEWEIATNVLPLFPAGKSPYSILVRKNFIRLRNKRMIKRAYRLSFDIDSRIQNAKLNNVNMPFSALINDFGDVTNLALRVGYEWQFHVQKFHFYYGYELIGAYKRLFYDATNSITNIQGVVYADDKQYSYGLRGLGGVKYFIHPRFAVSAETGLLLERIHQNSLQKQLNVASNTLEDFSYQRDVNAILYSPLLILNLSVLF